MKNEIYFNGYYNNGKGYTNGKSEKRSLDGYSYMFHVQDVLLAEHIGDGIIIRVYLATHEEMVDGSVVILASDIFILKIGRLMSINVTEENIKYGCMASGAFSMIGSYREIKEALENLKGLKI